MILCIREGGRISYMKNDYKALMLNPKDHVAVALEPIPTGAVVKVVCQYFQKEIELKGQIEFGHKFAVRPISIGEDILKYGEVIGSASTNIEAGDHVHTHNLEGKRGRGDRVGGK